MTSNDLREFIERVDQTGECQTIDGADCETDIGVLTELLQAEANPKLLLFNNIKGYPPGYRVVSNLFSTQRRTAIGLGLPEEVKGVDLVKAFRDKIKEGINLIPPVEVETGPIKENILIGDEVNLFKLPVPKWHERDGGKYIGTGGFSIQRDPDEGWINLGCYRVQIHDQRTVTAVIAPDHHGAIIRKKYWDRGMTCPVAISCGQEPLLFAASSWERVPWGTSEYDFAGGLRKKPVQVTKGITTDLLIPATAEIVLEGEIMSPEVETRQEGPAGEWTGYYAGGVRAQPAIKINAILHRNAPIIQGNPPSRLPGVWTLGRDIQKAAVLWDLLDKNLPGVSGVRIIEDAAIHSIVVISLKQSYDGQAKQAAFLAAGCSATGWSVRFIIVVDEDIDPFDNSQILWAMGTRCDPAIAINVISGCWGNTLDTMLNPEMKRLKITENSRAIILACKPYWWINDFPIPVESSPELLKKTREKFTELFNKPMIK
ncbi:UbiD family decarboxylase [Chloroflexota bacterium]